MDEERPATDDTADSDPEADEGHAAERSEEEPRVDPDARDENAPDAEGQVADSTTAAADPDEAAPDPVEPGESKTGESGSPGVPPPKADERRSDEGLALTTTTGDPAKDFRGPTVTEEARAGMGDDPALDEPGYGDLGHAEDYEALRED